MQSFLAANCALAVAFGTHLALYSLSGSPLGLLLLCGASILFSAWYGGVWPGIYALTVSLVLCIAFLLVVSPGVWRLGVDHVVQLIVFLFHGLLISMLCGQLRNTNELSQQTQRELQLAMSTVEQARNEAEDANRSQHEFLANTSHELRTPINAIMGLTQLSLKDEDLPGVIRDNLQTVNKSAASLLRLLNDLLDYSKIEAGSFDLRPRRFELDAALESAVRTHSSLASSKGLELACIVASDVPLQLIGDADRLAQVVSNLTGNAVKFTSQGEVVCRAELLEENETQATLKFSVRDTGPGIPADQQDAIFTAFRQVDASHTRQKGGVGLGLAIVSEVSAQMGGTVGVNSRIGEGSTFFFTAVFRKPKRVHQHKLKSNKLLAMLQGLTVLVVDDSPVSREIVTEMLSSWSMRPTAVDSAEAAMKRLQQDDDIQLIVVDALMPEMDGFDFLEELYDAGVATPALLMLSASDRAAFADRWKNLDIAGVIEKPVSQSELLDSIVHALQGDEELVVDRTAVPEAISLTLRVLLVEDTPANQKVVVQVLEKRGHEVAIATNGREAVEMAGAGDYDIILMDIQMPTMDGFQATTAIRAIENRDNANTPIIAMTAHAMSGDREKCLSAGMDGYIAKPIDIDELLEIVESFGGGEAPQDAGDRRTAVAADNQPTVASLWSESAALARLQGDRELLIDLINFFLEDTPTVTQQLRHALEVKDTREVERNAHSLKGLALGFAAGQAADAANSVEEAGRNGDLRSAGAGMERLETAFAALCDALTGYKQQGAEQPD